MTFLKMINKIFCLSSIKSSIRLSLLFLCFSFIQIGFAQETKNVLFIGNSQTFYNDLPKMTQNIANSLGDVLTYEESTIPSYSLRQHINNSETRNKIRKGGWDYVILQERSAWPALWDTHVEDNIYPYLQQLKDLIEETNPCAKIILYHTWGYKDGIPSSCATWPNVCDYTSMDNQLQDRFKEMATKFNAIIAPVGPVWRSLRSNYPLIELFDPDKTHPSLKGSFVGAMTFYTILFDKDANASTYDAGIPANEIVRIKNAVKAVSFEGLSNWKNIKEDEDVSFDFQIGANLEVTFTNKTEFADSYLWDFGDGTSSSDKNPKHTYASDGKYIVKLAVNRCGKSVEVLKTIIEGTLSIKELEKSKIQLFPNPVIDNLNINFLNIDVEINVYSIEGKLLFENLKPTTKNYRLDISFLKSGLYLLRITDKNNVLKFKNSLFVKK